MEWCFPSGDPHKHNIVMRGDGLSEVTIDLPPLQAKVLPQPPTKLGRWKEHTQVPKYCEVIRGVTEDMEFSLSTAEGDTMVDHRSGLSWWRERESTGGRKLVDGKLFVLSCFLCGDLETLRITSGQVERLMKKAISKLYPWKYHGIQC